MESTRRSLAFIVALFALATGSPAAATICAAIDASDCPCPMEHARAGEHCERSVSLAAAMNCCRQSAVETLAPTPNSVRTDERLLDAPTPAVRVVEVDAPATASRSLSATSPTEPPRRSPPDACALLSVFRI